MSTALPGHHIQTSVASRNGLFVLSVSTPCCEHPMLCSLTLMMRQLTGSSMLRVQICHVQVLQSAVTKITVQGRWKQSPDGQAQLDIGGKVVNNSHAKHTAKFWTLLFLAVRRRSYCTSASNWGSKAWKFNHTERKSYARTYPAGFYYSTIQSGNETTTKGERI